MREEGSVQGEPKLTRRKKLEALVGSIIEEGDTVVACDSKSKLWKDVDLKGAMQNWSMKYVTIAKSPGSTLRLFTRSERLANRMKISEVGEVGNLMKRTEVDAAKAGEIGKLENWCRRSR